MKKPTKLSSFITAIELILDEMPESGLWPTKPIKDKIEDALFAAKGIKRPPRALYELFYPNDNGVPWCRYLVEKCDELIEQYPTKYHSDMYEEFLTYWSAPNEEGVPKWWEIYIANNLRFHVPGRLATWAKNFRIKNNGRPAFRGKLYTAAEGLFNAAEELKNEMRSKNTW